MRGRIALAMSFVLVAAFAVGQQTPSASPLPLANLQPASPVVHYAGHGVTAPELLPFTLTNAPKDPCKRYDGYVLVSAIVDSNGTPRDVSLLHSSGDDLDKIALKLVNLDRFKPGTQDGVPVDVAVSIELSMSVCIESKKDDATGKDHVLRLRSAPGQKVGLQPAPSEAASSGSRNSPERKGTVVPRLGTVGSAVSAPVPIKMGEAHYTPQAKKAKVEGICLIGLVIDAYGMPQQVHVVKSLEPSLDQKAIEAVQAYRFKPAMKNGKTPVPVYVNIEVNFRLY